MKRVNVTLGLDPSTYDDDTAVNSEIYLERVAREARVSLSEIYPDVRFRFMVVEDDNADDCIEFIGIDDRHAQEYIRSALADIIANVYSDPDVWQKGG